MVSCTTVQEVLMVTGCVQRNAEHSPAETQVLSGAWKGKQVTLGTKVPGLRIPEQKHSDGDITLWQGLTTQH